MEVPTLTAEMQLTTPPDELWDTPSYNPFELQQKETHKAKDGLKSPRHVDEVAVVYVATVRLIRLSSRYRLTASVTLYCCCDAILVRRTS